jgi:hypothetical protein
MNQARSPGRAGHPISLQPLTLEQALKRAMSVPAPAHDPKLPKSSKGKRKATKQKKG